MNNTPQIRPTHSSHENARNLITCFGRPRLEPYRDIFKPTTDAELLGAYQWSIALGTSLHPLLGTLEIVLRNAIHQSLSLQCTGGYSLSFEWYDKAQNKGLKLTGISFKKVEEQLCERDSGARLKVQPSPDQVISRLSFGFWPNVLEALNKRYAPKTFLDVFPNHPHSKIAHWSVHENKNNLILRLKHIQNLRNRVSHFEPIWKPHWLGLQNANMSDCIKGLQSLHENTVELLRWCSPLAADHYEYSFGRNWFQKICTVQTVTAFMNAGSKDISSGSPDYSNYFPP